MGGVWLGYVLLLSVVVLWVVSGFFIQNLFSTNYNHPVAMTVFSVGMCSVLLLVLPVYERVLYVCAVSDPLVCRRASKHVLSVSTALLGSVWLLGQLTYNVSLTYLTVSASTAVSSVSPVFTFIFSVWILGYHLSVLSVVGVCVSVVGILCVATLGDNASVVGICIGVVSCASYGLFTTLLKRQQTLLSLPTNVVYVFGQFGLVALIIGVPLVCAVNFLGLDFWEFPSQYAIFGMCVNALIGSVLSDVLLAQSVLLLDPVTVAMGLALTMPFSLLIDSTVLKLHDFKFDYIWGIAAQFLAIYCIAKDQHNVYPPVKHVYKPPHENNVYKPAPV